MSIWAAFEHTLLQILRDRALLSLTVISVLFYAFYYPAPYAGQQAQELPLIVVDQDGSPLTRALGRKLEDTQAVHVVLTTRDLVEARTMVSAGRAEGFIFIPRGMTADLSAGRPGAGVAVALNAAYFARVAAIARSIAKSAEDLAARTSRLQPSDQKILSAPTIITQPLFNTIGGYRDYVFPAIATIILQQTLLFASARLVAERRRRGIVTTSLGEKLGTWCACTLLGVFAAAFVFGFAFWIQDIPRAGNVGGLLIAMPIFAATVSALGLALGRLFSNGDDALKLLMPTSLPLAFLAGFAWPLDQMPAFVHMVASLSPATAAMHLFIRFNQMGAAMQEALIPMAVLIVLLAAYGAWWLLGDRTSVSVPAE